MDKSQKLAGINGEQFFRKYIPSLKNTNGTDKAMGTCPFHADKTPSFSVNYDKKVFKCFGACGEKGGIFDFVKRKWGVDTTAKCLRILEEEGWIPADEKPQPKKDSTTKNKEKKEPNYLSLYQIKLIHQQLLKNESKLKRFKEKYGLSLDIIKQYLIGYQDGSYVIPREVKPDKWTYKNHKSYQLTGSKAGLYPGNDFKKDRPVIITEGEFKVLLLLQHGFQSTCGTAGARTWNREWNKTLYGLDVVIALDKDNPGKMGTEEVVEGLKNYARSIRVIKWPDFIGDKEDVTDFFIKYRKTKEDFQALIDDAREAGYEVKELDGIRFIEPQGFIVNDDHIIYNNFFKEKFVPITIFHSPLFITGRAIDVDNGTEEIELTFKRDGELKRLWTPRKIVADARKIIELSDTGLGVNSCNAKKIIEYIASFEARNMPRIPRKLITRGLGWKVIKNKMIFLLGNKIKQKPNKQASEEEGETSIEFKPEPGFERFVKALVPQGTYSEWKKAIEPTLKYPIAAFALYASFAAPLLRILKAPNFAVDFWGHTSSGKTTVLELASSVWGNPHKEAGGLVFAWDSTRVYLERIATFFGDVPIFPDDSQTVDDRTLTKILYMIINGGGRGRGSITGIRHTASWHSVCFSTGERPLVDCTTFAGARARTIEIYGSPFPNAGGEFINDLKRSIRENYGHASRKYVESLTSLLKSEEEVSQLRKDYAAYQKILSNEAGKEVGDRYSQYFATVKIAANLVSRFLDIGDPVEADESIYKVFSSLVSSELNDVDISTRAMEYVISWARSNENSFAKPDTSNSDIRECFGLWREGSFIGIYPHKFTEILSAKGFPDKLVRKGWAEKEWIQTPKDGKHFTSLQRIGLQGHNKSARFITIKWSTVEEFLQEEEK